MKDWPADALADRLIAIGLGALASGGAAYFIAGYPGFSLRLVPSLVSWIPGFVLLAIGLVRLAHHEEVKMAHFLQAFHVSDSQKVSVSLRARVGRWFRR